MEKPSIISQQTLIPLGLVLLILGMIATPIGIFFQLQNLTTNFVEFKSEVKEQIEKLEKVGSTTIYSDYAGVSDFCRNFIRNPTI